MSVRNSLLVLAALSVGNVAFAEPPQTPVRLDDKHGHAHGGEKHDLGKQTAGEMTVAVTQIGHVEAGKAATFEIAVTGGKPKAVRAWVGVESAEGSVKVKAKETEKFFDADLEVPNPLPEKSKFWVELETATGKTKVSFAYDAD